MRLPTHLPLVGSLALLAGCAPPPAAPGLTDPDAGTCRALAEPRHDLAGTTGSAAFLERGYERPRAPALLAAKLDADAAVTRGVTPADPELARIARAAADLLATLAEKARALADADAEGAPRALAALYGAMEAGAPVLAGLSARCAPEDAKGAGRLPPEVIQAVVRAGQGTMRQCYEDGLRRAPRLAGRVTTRFVISTQGTVSNAVDVDRAPPLPMDWVAPSVPKAMPDAAVSACVVAAFERLRFPAPEGGVVTVTYPILFTPGS
jgi:hypothetical protein